MEPIILASASPRRKDLLNQVGIPFMVQPSKLDEDMAELSGSPEQKAEQLASLKAWEVAENSNGRLVVGADTIVVLDDIIFGKPCNEDDAYQMLVKLSGREHNVITGIAVVDSWNKVCRTAREVTKVRFAHLSTDEIRSYIATGEPFGKAGAYAVQGIGALFVEGIMGCYTNVVGLPLMRLRRLLEEFGVKPL